MVRGREIEGLSALFAAGVAGGMAMAAGGTGIRLHACLSGLLVIVIGILTLFTLSQPHIRQGDAVKALAGIFLLLGCFCALTDAFPGLQSGLSLPLADRAVRELRILIDSIPYPSEDTSALIKALTTGDRTGLSRDTVQIFRDSGASHLLALSGLHIGIIYLILNRLTAFAGNAPLSRRIRYFLVVSTAGFYAVMTGVSPSIMRAFLFILIGETAKLLGRRRDPLKVLCLALTLQLACSPSVIRSVGFQLSYLAMAGIFLVYPPLSRLYPDSGNRTFEKFNLPRRIWNAAALSIACQLFTGPLAWHYFRTFPQYFLLTNLLAIPLTTALMALSLLVIFLSACGLCPAILLILNDFLVQLLLNVLQIISGM